VNHKPAPGWPVARSVGAAFLYRRYGWTTHPLRARGRRCRFIGIAGPANPRYIDLVFLFQEEGAYAIVDDINYLGRGARVMRSADPARRDTKENAHRRDVEDRRGAGRYEGGRDRHPVFFDHMLELFTKARRVLI